MSSNAISTSYILNWARVYHNKVIKHSKLRTPSLRNSILAENGYKSSVSFSRPCHFSSFTRFLFIAVQTNTCHGNVLYFKTESFDPKFWLDDPHSKSLKNDYKHTPSYWALCINAASSCCLATTNGLKLECPKMTCILCGPLAYLDY